jgi:segregation and condensation protein A
MELKEFLPKDVKKEKIGKEELTEKTSLEKISQDQLYDMLTSKEASWQAIIYELIKTEQLDPWDIDLALLSQKYLEKIRELEEANFFISSKVLLAASLLLRIKSEILLNRHIKSLDEVLFGKKEEKKASIEKIEIDIDELPELMPRTPLPRFRQVTLQELMSALNKAINTEHRRIKREISVKQAERLSQVDIPKTRINIRDRIRHIYAKISIYLKKKPKSRLSFTELVGEGREEKLAAFLPLLHLDNQQKVWLEQEDHFEEIWIWLYELYKKQRALDFVEEGIDEIEEELGLDPEKKRRIEKINKDFENPLANFFDTASKIMKGKVK